jgi:hypothetical protein
MKQRINPLELGCAYVRLQALGACFPVHYGEDRWEHDESYIRNPNSAERGRQR